MAWFYETFLPSLFERAGTNKSLWLTQKQTAVCIRYMERHSVRTDDFFGDRNTHIYYTCKWGERDVHLSYSKLNGCGAITFSFDNEEREESTRAAQEERERIENERIERIKRNPERLKKNVDILEREIQVYSEKLSWDDNEPDEIEFYESKVAEAKAKLAKLTV